VTDTFNALTPLESTGGTLSYYRLGALEDAGVADLAKIPQTVKILLENLLRMAETRFVDADDVSALAAWGRGRLADRDLPFAPARVILQDFTGVPAAVDLAAMRSAIHRAGGDASRIDPLVPVDLVIDHSVQVDAFGTRDAVTFNVEREYERNYERYALLRWAQQAFKGFRVVPPGMGIVHQVNLEHLATVVRTVDDNGSTIAIPDTLVGTDSHTPMINGLGVLGWGVGGIEAEAALLGQPLPLGTPTVVGFKLMGELLTGVTATDLVLTVTEILRGHGVVGKFVEFYGDGVAGLPVADRATLSNMSPEFGATASLWPIDDRTLDYLRLTGRDNATIDLVERYAKAQGLWQAVGADEPAFSETLSLDLSDVRPSLAGPRRPQDRVELAKVWDSFTDAYADEAASNSAVAIQIERFLGEGGNPEQPHTPKGPLDPDEDAVVETAGEQVHLHHGSVVIAAITSCTNTSNPSVMLAAGLLAKNAVERGLQTKPWVKTSMAPGSRVVTEYLEGAGLIPYLEKLGFHVVGYGCTTCIGNSGPLPDPVARAVDEHDLAVVSVLSGNRNFEGRIHPQVKASYLASPPLVVAYALTGTAEVDLTTDPLGEDPDGKPVYLTDIWPTPEAIHEAMAAVRSELFTREYARVFDGDERWQKMPSPEGALYEWDPASTYVMEPPFFDDLGPLPPPVQDIIGARVLVMVGDSVTTDHISPAGTIGPQSPAGKYLTANGVELKDFNSYGSRRGNHEVMVRGTFANIRLRNRLVEREGGFTRHFPDGEEMTIYDAAARYESEAVPLIVLAGKEYGSGSSRDWAAKGPRLQGVRAVISESFERIHRSNLVGMGVLPLEFIDGQNADSLGLTGAETFDLADVATRLAPHAELVVTGRRDDGTEIEFRARCRIDSDVELDYYQHGGVLQMVLRRLLSSER
jgi:aconitate hydratase